MSDDFFENIDNGVEDFTEGAMEAILKLTDELPETVNSESLSTEAISPEIQNRNMDFVLKNLKNSNTVTELAIKQVFKLAAASDSPRAWEVLSQLIKTQIDSSKTIADIIKDDKKANGNVTNNITQNNITQNNVMTTEDVMNLLADNDGDDDDDDEIEDAEIVSS